MQSIKKSTKSARISESKTALADSRRREINELLWDFYGEFPLVFSEWADVVYSPAQPQKAAAAE